MRDTKDDVFYLIFGRWHSQTLYAGWQYLDTRYPENQLMGAVEAVPA